MRKWIWSAVIALPLIAAGGLLAAHSGQDEAAPTVSENSPCPLQKFMEHLHSMHKQGLQHLLKHLHS